MNSHAKPSATATSRPPISVESGVQLFRLSPRKALSTCLGLCIAASLSWTSFVSCAPPDNSKVSAQEIEAELSPEIVTVVTVRWTTATPTKGYVEFGIDDDFDHTTPIETKATTEHSALLLGLVADTDYNFRVVTSNEGNTTASEIQSISTGSLPNALPTLELDGDEDEFDQFNIVSIIGSTLAATIFNSKGEYVWYHIIDDPDLTIYRTRLSLDGKSVLFNYANVSGDPSPDAELVRVSLDGTKVEKTPIPALAHDFVEHEDGTIGAMVVEFRDFNGEPLRGDKIIEIDPDGEETTIWTSWDCFDPEVDIGESQETKNYWTFGNALDYDPKEDVYYFGMRDFSSIAKIDRESGDCLWVLGDTGATISFADDTIPFLHQHQFEVRGDRVLVFDNEGYSLGGKKVSRAVEYKLDLDKMTATEEWSYVAEDPLIHSFVLGETIRLKNNDVLINWGAGGRLDRITEDGDSIWNVSNGLGAAFGFNTIAESLYVESPEEDSDKSSDQSSDKNSDKSSD